MKQYSYDGHGINEVGGFARRVFSPAMKPASDGGGYVLTDQERGAVGKMFAAAPLMLEALKIAQAQLSELTYDGKYQAGKDKISAAITIAEGDGAAAESQRELVSGPWIAQIEVHATFRDDGREEDLLEITNQDHSATMGYAVDSAHGQMFAAAPAMKAALELLLQAVEQNRFPTRDEWNIARQSIQPAGAVVHANKCEALALSFELLNNSDVRHFISTKLGEQARLHKALNALNKVVR